MSPRKDQRTPLLKRVVGKFLVGDGCWEWTAAVNSKGYGTFNIDNTIGARKNTTAHRAVYMALVGPIPEGLDLDHLCRNTLCVRPDHMEPVTRSENLRRGDMNRQRHKTHCPQGHPYDDLNTRLSGSGKRHCRACDKTRSKERRLAARLA